MAGKFTINPISGAGLTIVGAGLSGLIAGCAWTQARIVEAESEPQDHNALLRFRSDAVARLTGVEFRKVLVRKGIWANGQEAQPSIALANQYAQKVLGRVGISGERSIWNLAPVERFVAPSDFVRQLRARLKERISYGEAHNFGLWAEAWRDGAIGPVVSTTPMPVPLMELLRSSEIEDLSHLRFTAQPIKVSRWRLPGADLFQTVYFPTAETPVYRASFTGDLLIVEWKCTTPQADPAFLLKDVVAAFGFSGGAVEAFEPLDEVEQKYGKIIDLPEQERKRLLFKLTHEHGVYSLGRFATWRNVLLDDVVGDIERIKRLLMTANPYDLRRAAT